MNEKTRLKREFYNRPTLEVARDLLGKILVKKTEEGIISGRIVETEAYIGEIDKAAHCYDNKNTPRTRVMFGVPGKTYVYLIYGMYYCLNVVTEAEGVPAAVLIRGIEPIEGLEVMIKNRYDQSIEETRPKQIKNLTSGPGKLCRAFDITKKDNEVDLCEGDLYIAEEKIVKSFDIVTTTRINIDYAEEAADFPWRYYIKDNPYVSKK